MKPRFTTLGALLTSAAIIAASSVDAHDERRKTELFGPGVAHATDGTTAASDAPVRIGGLGSYGMKAAFASPEAQAWFEQGIGLLWGFNHAAAAQAFRAGQVADPDCAMCYWGEAYALGPNLNDVMHPENEARAQEAARLAAGHARTPREAAMAQALVLRYDAEVADQAARNAAFAAAISKVAADYPEDVAGDSASPLYRYGYYPHNVHFLLVAAQMAGKADEAVAAAEKLAAITSDEVSAQLAWVQAIRTAPYSAHAQFSDPETILALPQPDEGFPFLMGYWHYARGGAPRRRGDGARERDLLHGAAVLVLSGASDARRGPAPQSPSSIVPSNRRRTTPGRSGAAGRR